jgi:hypothetical protein
MNYPNNQFETLLAGLNTLKNHFDLTSVHPNTLHYVIYQQHSEGQKHNWLYNLNGTILKGHQLTGNENAVKLIEQNKDFKLYPDGCKDSHVESAVKKALKQIKQ